MDTVSLVAFLVLVVVMINQLAKFVTVRATSELTMLQPTYHKIAWENKINITLGLDFVGSPCELLQLELVDQMGTNDTDAFARSPGLKRVNVDFYFGIVHGEYLDDGQPVDLAKVIDDQENHRGCRVEGKLEVYKASGHLRIFPKESLAEQLRQANRNVDLTHRISALHYGDDSEELLTLRDTVVKHSTWSPLVGTIA